MAPSRKRVVEGALAVGCVVARAREQDATVVRAALREPRLGGGELDLDSGAHGGAGEPPVRVGVAGGAVGEHGAFELAGGGDGAERRKVVEQIAAQLVDRGELAPALACLDEHLADSRSAHVDGGGDLRLARPRAGAGHGLEAEQADERVDLGGVARGACGDELGDERVEAAAVRLLGDRRGGRRRVDGSEAFAQVALGVDELPPGVDARRRERY